jgi:hypothetical protein
MEGCILASKWFKLGQENIEGGFLATEYSLPGSLRGEAFSSGVPFSGTEELRLRSESPEHDGEAEDVLDNVLCLPVFSERLRSALGRAGIGTDDVQYVPVRVFRSTGEELPGYCIANVVACVPVLDRKHCGFLSEDPHEIDPRTNRPRVTGVGVSVLKAAPLAGHDLIRSAEFTPIVFVSERFYRVYAKGGFTGASLRPVSVVD